MGYGTEDNQLIENKLQQIWDVAIHNKDFEMINIVKLYRGKFEEIAKRQHELWQKYQITETHLDYGYQVAERRILEKNVKRLNDFCKAYGEGNNIGLTTDSIKDVDFFNDQIESGTRSINGAVKTFRELDDRLESLKELANGLETNDPNYNTLLNPSKKEEKTINEARKLNDAAQQKRIKELTEQGKKLRKELGEKGIDLQEAIQSGRLKGCVFQEEQNVCQTLQCVKSFYQTQYDKDPSKSEETLGMLQYVSYVLNAAIVVEKEGRLNAYNKDFMDNLKNTDPLRGPLDGVPIAAAHKNLPEVQEYEENFLNLSKDLREKFGASLGVRVALAKAHRKEFKDKKQPEVVNFSDISEPGGKLTPELQKSANEILSIEEQEKEIIAYNQEISKLMAQVKAGIAALDQKDQARVGQAKECMTDLFGNEIPKLKNATVLDKDDYDKLEKLNEMAAHIHHMQNHEAMDIRSPEATAIMGEWQRLKMGGKLTERMEAFAYLSDAMIREEQLEAERKQDVGVKLFKLEDLYIDELNKLKRNDKDPVDKAKKSLGDFFVNAISSLYDMADQGKNIDAQIKALTEMAQLIQYMHDDTKESAFTGRQQRYSERIKNLGLGSSEAERDRISSLVQEARRQKLVQESIKENNTPEVRARLAELNAQVEKGIEVLNGKEENEVGTIREIAKKLFGDEIPKLHEALSRGENVNEKLAQLNAIANRLEYMRDRPVGYKMDGSANGIAKHLADLKIGESSLIRGEIAMCTKLANERVEAEKKETLTRFQDQLVELEKNLQINVDDLRVNRNQTEYDSSLNVTKEHLNFELAALKECADPSKADFERLKYATELVELIPFINNNSNDNTSLEVDELQEQMGVLKIGESDARRLEISHLVIGAKLMMQQQGRMVDDAERQAIQKRIAELNEKVEKGFLVLDQKDQFYVNEVKPIFKKFIYEETLKIKGEARNGVDVSGKLEELNRVAEYIPYLKNRPQNYVFNKVENPFSERWEKLGFGNSWATLEYTEFIMQAMQAKQREEKRVGDVEEQAMRERITKLREKVNAGVALLNKQEQSEVGAGKIFMNNFFAREYPKLIQRLLVHDDINETLTELDAIANLIQYTRNKPENQVHGGEATTFADHLKGLGIGETESWRQDIADYVVQAKQVKQQAEKKADDKARQDFQEKLSTVMQKVQEGFENLNRRDGNQVGQAKSFMSNFYNDCFEQLKATQVPSKQDYKMLTIMDKYADVISYLNDNALPIDKNIANSSPMFAELRAAFAGTAQGKNTMLIRGLNNYIVGAQAEKQWFELVQGIKDFNEHTSKQLKINGKSGMDSLSETRMKYNTSAAPNILTGAYPDLSELSGSGADALLRDTKLAVKKAYSKWNKVSEKFNQSAGIEGQGNKRQELDPQLQKRLLEYREKVKTGDENEINISKKQIKSILENTVKDSDKRETATDLIWKNIKFANTYINELNKDIAALEMAIRDLDKEKVTAKALDESSETNGLNANQKNLYNTLMSMKRDCQIADPPKTNFDLVLRACMLGDGEYLRHYGEPSEDSLLAQLYLNNIGKVEQRKEIAGFLVYSFKELRAAGTKESEFDINVMKGWINSKEAAAKEAAAKEAAQKNTYQNMPKAKFQSSISPAPTSPAKKQLASSLTIGESNKLNQQLDALKNGIESAMKTRDLPQLLTAKLNPEFEGNYDYSKASFVTADGEPKSRIGSNAFIRGYEILRDLGLDDKELEKAIGVIQDNTRKCEIKLIKDTMKLNNDYANINNKNVALGDFEKDRRECLIQASEEITKARNEGNPGKFETDEQKAIRQCFDNIKNMESDKYGPELVSQVVGGIQSRTTMYLNILEKEISATKIMQAQVDQELSKQKQTPTSAKALQKELSATDNLTKTLPPKTMKSSRYRPQTTSMKSGGRPQTTSMKSGSRPQTTSMKSGGRPQTTPTNSDSTSQTLPMKSK